MMLRKRATIVTALLGIAAGLATGRAPAAETPLAAIPEEASVVIRWKTPKQTFDKTQRLVNQIDPEIGDHLKGAGLFLGLLVSNPTLAGVDEKGDWWAAVFPQRDAEPGIVFAVPTTDADAARQAVGDDFHFVTHENWLLYTDKQPLARQLQARVGGTGRSIESLIGADSRQLLDAGDLTAFVNVQRLVETYRADLDGTVEQVEGQLNMLENMPFPSPGFEIKAVLDAYRTVFRGLVQLLRDSRTLAVAVRVEEGGFGFEDLLIVAEGSATATAFERHKPSRLELLGRMPAGRLAYIGFRGDMQGLTEWTAEFEAAMLPDDPEVRKAVREMVEGYSKLKLGDYVTTIDLADLETGFVRSAVAYEVEPAEAARELTRKTTVRAGTVETGDFKQEVELRTNAEAYGPYRADITTIRQQFGEDNPFGQGQDQMMQMMFGPEGLTTRTVYLKDTVVQTVGGGRQTMETALGALAGGEGAAAASQDVFQTARRQLLPEANLAVLLDVPALMADILRLVSASGIPVPLTPDDAKKLELDRSYTGLSVTTGSTTLRAKIWVPIEQAKGVATVVRTIEKLASQPEF